MSEIAREFGYEALTEQNDSVLETKMVLIAAARSTFNLKEKEITH